MKIKDCSLCNLHTSRTKIVCGTGDGNIMFIGEAPGKAEDELGVPFVGRAGMVLRALLDKVGFDNGFYITNVVKCRPPDNREPLREEIIACSIHLNRELELYKPNLIVAVGKVAAGALDKELPLKRRGLPSMVDNVLNYTTPLYLTHIYHPAAALYNPLLLSTMEEHLFILKNFIDKLKRGDI